MKHTNGNPAKIARNHSIAEDRVSGMTYKEIAKKHNLTYGHIGAILRDEQIRKVIKKSTSKIVELTPLAVNKFRKILVDENHSEHYKAVKDCLVITGIAPSHAQNNYITNILQVNVADNVDTRVQELYQTHFQDFNNQDDQIIDAEYRNSEDDN